MSENVEVQDELSVNDLSQEVTTQNDSITLQSLEDLNSNMVTGTLGIVTCLGFVFGALLGSVYANITR